MYCSTIVPVATDDSTDRPVCSGGVNSFPEAALPFSKVEARETVGVDAVVDVAVEAV